ncbi:hypothetical protein GAY28_10685 [Azospirillum brasilense]|nr:hypothetical protein [Azospirillum brasilense]
MISFARSDIIRYNCRMHLSAANASVAPKETFLIGYARPGRGKSVVEQIEALRGLGIKDKYIYADEPDKDGVGRKWLDEACANLRRGDLFCVTSLDKLAPNKADLLAFLEGLEIKGVGVVSVEDGLDPRLPAADQVTRLAKALHRAERSWCWSWPRQQALAAGRAKGPVGGRKPILNAAEVKQLIRLRDTTTMTWVQLADHFTNAGKPIKEVTLRVIYRKQKKREK